MKSSTASRPRLPSTSSLESEQSAHFSNSSRRRATAERPLFQIARNGALDLLRRRGRVEFVPLDEEPAVPAHAAAPDERLEIRQRYDLLDAALRSLPAEHREILLLREVEELSYAEIGTALEIHEGTVKSRLARARVALLERCRRTHREEDRG